MAISVLHDDKQVIVIIPKKEAISLGTLLDACLDTVGAIEGGDVDLTSKQISRAEDNMISLASQLQGLEQTE
jgi:hypothetical protein